MNWGIDYENLLKQSRQLGMLIPIAGPFVDDPRPLQAVGGTAGTGLVVVKDFQPDIQRSPMNAKLYALWAPLQRRWKEPYDSILYRYPGGSWNLCLVSFYWFFDVMQRAGTTDPEKMIKIWEGDVYDLFDEELTMRACDHQVVLDMHCSEFEFPNPWFDDAALFIRPNVIPAKYCLPPVPVGLKRCE